MIRIRIFKNFQTEYEYEYEYGYSNIFGIRANYLFLLSGKKLKFHYTNLLNYDNKRHFGEKSAHCLPEFTGSPNYPGHLNFVENNPFDILFNI